MPYMPRKEKSFLVDDTNPRYFQTGRVFELGLRPYQ